MEIEITVVTLVARQDILKNNINGEKTHSYKQIP